MSFTCYLLILNSFFVVKALEFSGQIQEVCTSIESDLPGRVFYPDSAAFNHSIDSYAYVEARLRPTCVVGPRSAEDVSKSIKILTKFPKVEFAVRSGGHNTNKGFANTDHGITIDLAGLDAVEVNDYKHTVSIGVGARWEKVYAAVERYGLTVQGGRVGSVGTGGYITGGGIGYFSPDKGWTCDSVTNFEIILANGTLVYANAYSNTDLFRALKGGSNNFGIVTSFDLDTIDQALITGGTMYYGNVTGEEVFATLTTFKQPQNFDKYAMLLVFTSYEVDKGSFSYSASFYHARPDKYTGSTVEAFTKIEPKLNTSLAVQNNTAGFFANQTVFGPAKESKIYMHWTNINVRVTPAILDRINTCFRNSARALEDNPAYRNKNLTFTLVLQSVPLAKPGNIFGFDPASHPEKDMINLLVMLSFIDGSVEDKLGEEIEALTRELKDVAREEGALSQFVYLNYAGRRQRVLEGYGEETVKRLREVAKKYDPKEVFQRQVKGGYKLLDVGF